jgi:hypothetical protein
VRASGVIPLSKQRCNTSAGNRLPLATHAMPAQVVDPI